MFSVCEKNSTAKKTQVTPGMNLAHCAPTYTSAMPLTSVNLKSKKVNQILWIYASVTESRVWLIVCTSSVLKAQITRRDVQSLFGITQVVDLTILKFKIFYLFYKNNSL